MRLLLLLSFVVIVGHVFVVFFLLLLSFRRFPSCASFCLYLSLLIYLALKMFWILYHIPACISCEESYHKWADERWCMCGECRMMTSSTLGIRYIHTLIHKIPNSLCYIGSIFSFAMDSATSILIGCHWNVYYVFSTVSDFCSLSLTRVLFCLSLKLQFGNRME